MRLLHVEPDGTFSLAEYFGDEVPPYAILSHTWGSDNEEVSFKDLTEGRGSNKRGYEKLTFCARRVLYDGLRYFWVDICCIDKSSSAELSEAINSMFRWYKEAMYDTQCQLSRLHTNLAFHIAYATSFWSMSEHQLSTEQNGKRPSGAVAGLPEDGHSRNC